ncbi:gamma-butyrobetaine hydroxylase-like domain-containing protein [uncultured Pseudomonas sp.]|uniref:gamma-butyrobetaine hydroxylase-like domain-containing protein n=1 Tax=uncultured Pseudomonas sp. TaxID=114707 RepID=UPI002583D414|nr:gamma-butyrobetaine hydroxylase-like domain-containing protein [uncultured Pseudomonas sp.]
MNGPSRIHNQRAYGLLTVQWPDAEAVISHVRLRGNCPCSQCRAAGLQGRVMVVRDDVRVERLIEQGYGVLGLLAHACRSVAYSAMSSGLSPAE